MSRITLPTLFKKLLANSLIVIFNTLFFVLILAEKGYSQNNGATISSGQPNPNEDYRKRIYENALIKVYYEKPEVYKIHNRIINEPATATFYLDMYTLPTVKNVYRFVGGPGGTALTWAAEIDERDNNIATFHQMANDPDEVRRTAEVMTQEMIKPKSYRNNEIKSVYEQTHKFEGSNKLPYGDDLEYLKQMYPDIADKFTPEKIAKEKAKLESLKAKDPNAYSKYIKENYLKLPTNPQTQKLTDEQKRKIELTKYRESFAETQANFQAGVEILSIIDPKMAGFVSKTGNAVFKIYDAAHNIFSQGFVDLKNLGNIANGVGLFLSLFSEDGTAKALQEILANQRKILDKLADLEIKTEKIQLSLNYLIQLTSYNQEKILSELGDIQQSLKNIDINVYNTQEFNRLLQQEQRIIDYKIKKETIINEFYRNAGTAEWKHRLLTMKYPYYENNDEKIFFKKIEDALSELSVFATQILDDPTYITYNDLTDVGTLSLSGIESKRKTDVSQRMAMLPFMGLWLNAHLNPKEKYVAYDESTPQKPDGVGLNVKIIGNPRIFSYLVQQYLQLASYRLVKYKPNGDVIEDKNIQKLCEDFKRTTEIYSQMQMNVPLAIAILNFHLKRLKSLHDIYLSSMAQSQNLNITPNNVDSKLAPKVLYGGLKLEEIQAKLTELPMKDFVTIGQKIGAFEIKERPDKTEITKSKHVGSVRNENDRDIILGQAEIKIKYIIPTGNLLIANTYLPQLLDYEREAHYYSRAKETDQWNDDGLSAADITVQETKKQFTETLAKYIFNKHKDIAKAWIDELNGKPIKQVVDDVYRSRFILETLVIGGYGLEFDNIKELKEVASLLKDANSAISFIENSWQKALNVVEDSLIDYSTTPFPMYFKNHCKFIENKDSANKFTSIVVDYKIPQNLDPSLIMDIGNFNEARYALEWASQFADIKPSCIDSKKGNPK